MSSTKSKIMTVRAPTAIVEQCKAEAKKKGITLSEWLTIAAVECLPTKKG